MYARCTIKNIAVRVTKKGMDLTDPHAPHFELTEILPNNCIRLAPKVANVWCNNCRECLEE